MPTPAYAVPAGCYLGEGNGANTYTSTTCPTEGVARAVGQFQACFVVLPGGTYEERNCEKLDESENEVPESRTITSGAGNDEIFESGTPRDQLSDGQCEPENNEELNAENCGIIDIVVTVINFLSAFAGIAIIASLMIAGFIYMTAQDDPGKVQKAKSRIVQTLIALVLFIFMYALLNFLVPGGVL